MISVSSSFIFQTFAEVCYSVFVNRSSFKSVLSLRKAYIFSLLKVYYRSVFNESSKAFIFQKCEHWKFTPWVTFYFGLSLHIFLWKMSATPGACIKPDCLARRPLCHEVNLPASCEAQRLLCHKVNLLSCVAWPPQSKSTELCTSAAVIPQSKSTEMWSWAAPFHHDLWYFRHWTNENFSSVIYSEKRDQPILAPLKPLKSIHSTKLLEKFLTWAAHTFHWRFWWFPWNVWNWEV